MAKKRTLSYHEVAALAESVGLPGKTFAQIAKGESGYQPGAIGHDPGGTKGLGLWQITTKYNDDIIKKFGGRKAMLDPVQNAKAAKAIYDRQGIKAWYGTKYMTSPNAHYTGSGKPPRASKVATSARSPQPSDDFRKQIALSLLGIGGGYGDSDPLSMALLAAAQRGPVGSDSPSLAPSAPKSGGQVKPGLYKLAKVAQNKFGLSVRELEPFDKVDPVHTKGSFHYSNRAMDVSGSPEQMKAFNKYVARKHGRWVAEMFYDKGVNLDNGKRTGPIGGHGSHVHVAV